MGEDASSLRFGIAFLPILALLLAMMLLAIARQLLSGVAHCVFLVLQGLAHWALRSPPESAAKEPNQ